MRPEKSVFHKNPFCAHFFLHRIRILGSLYNAGLTLKCHTRLCFVTAVGLWPLLAANSKYVTWRHNLYLVFFTPDLMIKRPRQRGDAELRWQIYHQTRVKKLIQV